MYLIKFNNIKKIAMSDMIFSFPKSSKVMPEGKFISISSEHPRLEDTKQLKLKNNIDNSKLEHKEIIWRAREPEIKDTEEIKRKYVSYRKIATLIALVMVIIVSGLLYNYYNTNIKLMISDFDNKGSIYWLNNFVKGNYEECDSIIDADSDKLYNQSINYYVEDEYFYECLLKEISASIKDMKVIYYDRDGNTITYKIKVKYSLFTKLDSLSLTDEQVKDLKNKKQEYKDSKIAISDIADYYNKLYKNVYVHNCFKKTDNIETAEYTITETTDVNGNTTIDGVNDCYLT